MAVNEKFVILTGTSITSYLITDQKYGIFFPHGPTVPRGPGPPHYRGFAITLRHTTCGRTPLDEWSARLRYLYLTTHNTEKRQPSMPPAGFESAIPSSERPQTHALDHAVAGFDIGLLPNILSVKILSIYVICYAEVVLCIKSLQHLRDTWPLDRKVNVPLCT
jgi:hypothetical protein